MLKREETFRLGFFLRFPGYNVGRSCRGCSRPCRWSTEIIPPTDFRTNQNHDWKHLAGRCFSLVCRCEFDRFRCTEGNSIALEDPYFYLKYYLPILPPLMTWATLVLYMRRDGVWHFQSRCISQVLVSVKGGGWDSKLLWICGNGMRNWRLTKITHLVYYIINTLVH